MVKSSNAANVIDLESYRQRKLREVRAEENMSMATDQPPALLVPVWFCWVPMWTPVVG